LNLFLIFFIYGWRFLLFHNFLVSNFSLIWFLWIRPFETFSFLYHIRLNNPILSKYSILVILLFHEIVILILVQQIIRVNNWRLASINKWLGLVHLIIFILNTCIRLNLQILIALIFVDWDLLYETLRIIFHIYFSGPACWSI
jgi:hypothetical protein